MQTEWHTSYHIRVQCKWLSHNICPSLHVSSFLFFSALWMPRCGFRDKKTELLWSMQSCTNGACLQFFEAASSHPGSCMAHFCIILGKGAFGLRNYRQMVMNLSTCSRIPNKACITRPLQLFKETAVSVQDVCTVLPGLSNGL